MFEIQISRQIQTDSSVMSHRLAAHAQLHQSTLRVGDTSGNCISILRSTKLPESAYVSALRNNLSLTVIICNMIQQRVLAYGKDVWTSASVFRVGVESITPVPRCGCTFDPPIRLRDTTNNLPAMIDDGAGPGHDGVTIRTVYLPHQAA